MTTCQICFRETNKKLAQKCSVCKLLNKKIDRPTRWDYRKYPPKKKYIKKDFNYVIIDRFIYYENNSVRITEKSAKRLLKVLQAKFTPPN